MAVEKYTAGAGVGYTWTAAFATANLTSLANGSSVLSSQGDITNQTAQDIFADVSFNLAAITTVAPNYLALFLYPLNQDGTTYGDNNFVAGTQKAATPSASYLVGVCTVPIATTTAVHGMFIRIVLIPGTFRFVIQNNLGVAMSASTNTIQYRTYNRQIA